MCGILGYINRTAEPDFFLKALNSMVHRGPDGYGIWQDDQVGFGHRRLAIIDTSEAATQPMHAKERYVMVFNGEIYNYRELKTELEKEGVRFHSQSDSEVLLHAYINWGPTCLQKFNGMWAFAIWDKQERTLFLSRDRLGKKPLFYAEIDGAFVFASEMKGIYPFLSKVEINTEIVQKAIQNSFSYESGEACLIRGIKRFPAASYGTITTNGKLKITSFWNCSQVQNTKLNYEEQIEKFRELFFDACKIRMRSDVTIGTALSGGLDSSAIICTMAKLAGANAKDIQKDWQHAFVASFPGTSLDETAYAQQVVEHIGISSDFITIDPIKELNAIYEQSYLFEELYYAPTIPFVQLYGQIKQKGVTVSIDGHGADEIFGGYPFDLNYALADALPKLKKFNEIIRCIQAITETEGNDDYSNKLKFALLLKYPFLRRFSKNAPGFKPIGNFDFLNSKLFESSFQTFLPTLLRNYDRYSMMNGVEIRMPFLDYRLVEFAFSIPYSSKVNGGFSKVIIRDALKDILPKNIAFRKKKIGFNAPMHHWMRSEMKNWIRDTINSNDFLTSGLIDSLKIKRELEQLLSKKEISYLEGERSFAALMPFIWEKSLKLHHEH